MLNTNITAAPLTYRAFIDVRAAQAQSFGRPLSHFDRAVSDAVFRATCLAMDDVRQDCRDKVFRVVSAPTGSGKTVSVAAAIMAAYMTDASFT